MKINASILTTKLRISPIKLKSKQIKSPNASNKKSPSSKKNPNHSQRKIPSFSRPTNTTLTVKESNPINLHGFLD
jgi:hypothetical protein